VTITGTNLNGATSVTFGGAIATSFTVNSATQITATTPAGSGTVSVAVTTTRRHGDGQLRLRGGTTDHQQHLARQRPRCRRHGRDDFRRQPEQRDGHLRLDAVALASNSATQIVVTTPAHVTGGVVVTVTTGGGTTKFGGGDGTFASAVNYVSDANPRSVAVGDFNGDGKLDVITANVGGTVSVFLGMAMGRSRQQSNTARRQPASAPWP